MNINAALADRLRIKIGQTCLSTEWGHLRDWIDTETGGELDCFQLDMLSDMVKDRLTPNSGAHPRPSMRHAA